MRLLLRLAGVLISLLVLGVAALFVIPTERLANLAARQLEGVTGRSVVFSGDVRPTIYPVIGVRTGPVSVSNAGWSDAGPMFQADGLDIALDLGAVMRGEVTIRRIGAEGPRIVLERHSDGRVNWDFAPATTAASGSAAQPSGATGVAPFTIDTATISNGSLRFIDHQTGEALALSGLDLTFALPDFDGPADLAAAAMLNGQRVEVEARLARFATAISGQVSDVRAAVSVGGVRLAFDGRAGSSPLAAEGRVEFDLPDPAPVFAALGQAAPGLPAGFDRAISGSARVTLAPAGSVHLRDLALRAPAGQIAGAADLTFDGPRPRLVASVSSNALNLASLAGGGEGGTGAGAAAPSGWPRDMIDASGLAALDADISVSADRVDLGGMVLAPVRLGLTIDRARAVFDLRQIGLYDGALSGEFVVNARSGLSTGGNLRADGINLLPLLRDAAGFERLAGTGNAALRFLAVGNSIDAMMRSLSGEGRIDLGQGEIIGFDLAGMLRSLDLGHMGANNRTIYRAITGSFTIADGVLRNTDLAMDASRVTATGSGSVDIGAQTLDYRIIPVALADGDGAGGVRVPLLIRGPWSALRFNLDLEGMAQERLRLERERLEERARTEAREAEARARERAEQELSERLRLERQEGERLEDAARRRLEQEAGDRLRGLLLGR